MIEGLYPIFKNWHESGSVFIYSDPHFGKDDMPPAMYWPKDADQIASINQRMGKNDVFICLGDIGKISWVPQIRARYKILICGNHDAGVSNYRREIKQGMYLKDKYSKHDLIKILKQEYPNCSYNISDDYSSFWLVDIDNRLFDEVYEGPLMIGEKIILSHEPLDIDWAVNLHGHDHSGKYHPDKYHYNFCSNVIDYKPINLNQFMKSGFMSGVQSIHRSTINEATKRKKARNKK